MRKRQLSLSFFITFFALAPVLWAQVPSVYRFSLDLRQTEGDQLSVSLLVPEAESDTLIYALPKIIPGTYSVYDFGRFVTDFRAYDQANEPLPVARLNDNQWQITDARRLHRLTYRVEDTYDTDKDNVIFEPAGTNIDPDNANFVINPHGFFGYFEGKKFIPFEINIYRPKDLYGSTALVPKSRSDTSDVFWVENYHDLVDAPMMYNRPDTTTLHVANAEILVSVYSPQGKLRSGEVARGVSAILEAQKNYLGGKLPIDRYAFIIYLFNGPSQSGAYGALEHASSSFYFLPEYSSDLLMPTIIDVAAHEFFHILTPLNIHSEEIHYFDFIQPKMSKHLWLYEGTVEYFAQHVQLYEGMIDLPEFMVRMSEKITSAKDQYRSDLSFTELSLGALDTHKEQYGNVYQKGALISFCLDVLLRKHSNGEMGMMDLMQKLATRYGKDKPFKDDELFEVIAEMTYPEVGDFLRKHVAGTDPLPLQETFTDIGIRYQSDVREKELVTGLEGIIGYNPETKELLAVNLRKANAVGKQLKFKRGDVIQTINGEAVNPENIRDVFAKLSQNAAPGQALVVEVRRPKKSGKFSVKKCKTYLAEIDVSKGPSFRINPDATDAQIATRKAWANL